jgi:hypothetical protein
MEPNYDPAWIEIKKRVDKIMLKAYEDALKDYGGFKFEITISDNVSDKLKDVRKNIKRFSRRLFWKALIRKVNKKLGFKNANR